MAAVLLSTATLASAWSAYQATRWGGIQAISLSQSTAHRSESLRASNMAYQQAQVDVTTFVAWALSRAQGNERAATFLQQRFRPEFLPAFQSWLASGGRTDAAPPGTPFTRPEYQLEARKRSDQLSAQAEAAAGVARRANQIGDNYVFSIVLFTSAVFFAGIQTKIVSERIRLALLGLASVVLVCASFFMLRLPVNIGF